MSAVMEVRKRRKDSFKERHGIGLGFMSFFTKATVGVLKAFPRLNAEIQGDELVLKHYYDIGIAVGAEEGLVVPVLRDAQLLTLAATSTALRDLHARAQAHTLSQAELRGSTFTVSNLGIYGVDSFTAIINPPESAILAVGRIVETPVARNGVVVVRPIMQLTLSADHRIVDGATAARFLAALRERLEEPYLLI